MLSVSSLIRVSIVAMSFVLVPVTALAAGDAARVPARASASLTQSLRVKLAGQEQKVVRAGFTVSKVRRKDPAAVGTAQKLYLKAVSKYADIQDTMKKVGAPPDRVYAAAGPSPAELKLAASWQRARADVKRAKKNYEAEVSNDFAHPDNLSHARARLEKAKAAEKAIRSRAGEPVQAASVTKAAPKAAPAKADSDIILPGQVVKNPQDLWHGDRGT